MDSLPEPIIAEIALNLPVRDLFLNFALTKTDYSILVKSHHVLLGLIR